jgi:hypothetical protein
MQTINLTSITKELTVEASQQTAFKVFTEQMDLWWPRTHHIGSTDMTEMVVELQVNGRWYSKHTEPTQPNIGYVMRYEPFDLFVLAWQINGDFKCDPALVTEVVVQFIPNGSQTTRVKFEHKDLHKLGNGKAVESMDQGWGDIMAVYKQQAEK